VSAGLLQELLVGSRKNDDRHIEGEQEKFEIEPPHMARGLIRRDAQIRELPFLE